MKDKFKYFCTNFAKYIGLVFLIFYLVSCDESKTPNKVDLEHDYVSGDSFTVKVYLYESQKELQNAYSATRDVPPGHIVEGFAEQYYQVKNRTKIVHCNIHVMDSPNDPDSRIWVYGHELKHCIKGRYHAE